MDEGKLLRLAQHLDPDALAMIHDRYYVPIYRFVAYRVGDDAMLAEDLTSDVFTRLLEAIHGGQAPSRTLRGWLFQVASNVVNDHLREVYRHQRESLTDQLPSDETGQTSQVQIKLRAEQLIEAMHFLTPEQSEVLALRYGAGFSIREVAEQVGSSEGAVKMMQARAIKALGRFLEAPHA